MIAHDPEDLRPFCRDEIAFEQLKQVLAQRKAQREQCLLQVAQQVLRRFLGKKIPALIQRL